MYKYIRAFELGYKWGINEAFNDQINNINKKFKYIDDRVILSKLYDIGYIKAYKKYNKYFKNK